MGVDVGNCIGPRMGVGVGVWAGVGAGAGAVSASKFPRGPPKDLARSWASTIHNVANEL